jgi:hypothetical protein
MNLIPKENLFNVAGTPLANVKFQFVTMTPALAAEPLKANKKNRRVKQDTVDAYARDMRNGEWVTNHQGGALSEEGNILDFQHRLLAVVQSGCTIVMLVSTGWPQKMPKQKVSLMDSVDMGCPRNIRDQMEMLHGFEDARVVVNVSGGVAGLVTGMDRVRRKSPAAVLTVAAAYANEFRWLEKNIATTNGIKSATMSAVLGLAAWPDATRAFYEQLKTGTNLTATSPVLHLRRANQWLAEWMARGWISNAGFRQYIRTAKFGK